MYASATCSTSHFLPQKAKRFDSMSFAAFRLRCPGCRNSVAFEFRVIPLEHVCFCYLFYITLPSAKRNALTRMYASATCSTSHFLPQTAKRFDSVSFRGIPTSMPRLPKFSCL
ncbi:hypothetical protein D5086_021153 [Populus alba]|uniref:Uncharacterized protein n=1 Tax=Populus alba TaxID=43335 RepID=A0ACC4BBB7_POPAL